MSGSQGHPLGQGGSAAWLWTQHSLLCQRIGSSSLPAQERALLARTQVYEADGWGAISALSLTRQPQAEVVRPHIQMLLYVRITYLISLR